MDQAEVVKEGCSVYNHSESCPGKGTPPGLLQVGETGLRCPQPKPALQEESVSFSLGERTMPVNTWVQFQFCL